MRRLEIIKKIMDEGIVAVIRATSKEEGEKIIDAVTKGGINCIEVTMTVPGAIDIIKDLANKYKNDPNIIIGAGTVLDSETARMCILAGAEYIVGPNFNPEVVKLCNRYRVPVMPGIMTVNELVEALELGVEILKVFPGSAYGPSIIKAFKGPIPQANFMPTGGVSLDNIDEWIKNGAVAVGTGSSLTKGAKTGDYHLVTETARKFVETVKEAKEKYGK